MSGNNIAVAVLTVQGTAPGAARAREILGETHPAELVTHSLPPAGVHAAATV